MAENMQSAAHPATSSRQHVPDLDRSVASAVWVIPSPVLLTADQVAAALYAFSELIDECASPALPALREEVRYVVARHGTDAIERIAERIAAHGIAQLPDSLGASVARVDHRARRARLAWSRHQSQLLLAADG